MKTTSTNQILSMTSTLLFCALLVVSPACSVFGAETRTCSITCYSQSTGTNLGTESYDNYTQEECEQALENRQTNLTQCTLEWD